MKLTEEIVIEIARELLSKIGFSYDGSELRVNKLDERRMQIHKITKPTWIVGISYGKEFWGKSRSAFLYMDDESKMPIFMRLNQGWFIFEVLEDGTIKKTFKNIGQK